jgi:hypothetical protein
VETRAGIERAARIHEGVQRSDGSVVAVARTRPQVLQATAELQRPGPRVGAHDHPDPMHLADHSAGHAQSAVKAIVWRVRNSAQLSPLGPGHS